MTPRRVDVDGERHEAEAGADRQALEVLAGLLGADGAAVVAQVAADDRAVRREHGAGRVAGVGQVARQPGRPRRGDERLLVAGRPSAGDVDAGRPVEVVRARRARGETTTARAAVAPERRSASVQRPGSVASASSRTTATIGPPPAARTKPVWEARTSSSSRPPPMRKAGAMAVAFHGVSEPPSRLRRVLRAVAVDAGLLRRRRDYRLLVAGQFVSLAGSQLTFVALPFQMYDLTRSTLAVGLLGVAEFVPILVVALVSGALADAFDRRLLVRCRELGSAVVSRAGRQRAPRRARTSGCCSCARRSWPAFTRCAARRSTRSSRGSSRASS